MRILLVNPNYYEAIYGRSVVKMAINRGTSPLGLALLAALAEQAGHQAEVLDMNANDLAASDLLREVARFRPDLVGFTMVTPMYPLVKKYAADLRKHSFAGILAAGGPHPTALPGDTLSSSELDFLVTGPADILFAELAAGRWDYQNVWNKQDGAVTEGSRSLERALRLDDLPFPRYRPGDIAKYVHPPLTSRRNPVANMETSRGCFADCVFCNKKIFGRGYIAKSPGRIVDEVDFLLREGFREIHIVDDGFSTRPERVISMCEEILSRGLDFTWYPNGGIRADRVSPEMFSIMKRAGCYKVPFGVESGSQKVLDAVGKGITLEAIERAVRLAGEAGLETECNFMLGLPTETQADAFSSFRFAKRLKADYVKFAITIPLPGTRLFSALEAEGRILSRDWGLFNYATDPALLYAHDSIGSRDLFRLYKKFNKGYYFRISYVLNRLRKSIHEKRLWSDLKNACLLLSN